MHFIKIAFSQFPKIYTFEIWLNHVMVIRKISIVNIQPVKGNFSTRKHFHVKLSTRKFMILIFQLVKSNWLTRKNIF